MSHRNISASIAAPTARPVPIPLSPGIPLDMEPVYFRTIYAQFIEPTSKYKQGPNNN